MKGIVAVLAALLLVAAGLEPAAPGAAQRRRREPAKGLGQDAETEKRLAAALDELVRLIQGETIDYRAVFEKVQDARAIVLGFAPPDQARTRPAGPDTPELPAKTPLVVIDGVRPAEALRRLREQLDYCVRSARGIPGGETKYLREWTGQAGFRSRNLRPPALAAALRESARAALLLSRPAETVRVKRGAQLFADDFAEGAAGWLSYGQCATRREGGALRMTDREVPHPDAMMWTKQQFEGDFLVEFAFTPHTKGTSAGALFTICGRPREGKTLAVCVGATMNTYNYGIDGYHFSMHRGTTGLGNVRRVGPGLKLLMSGRDPCPTPGRAYRVAVGKSGPTIFLIVDGRLVHEYLDAGTHGPVLTGGHVGIRHWAGMDGSYRDFRIHRLVGDE